MFQTTNQKITWVVYHLDFSENRLLQEMFFFEQNMFANFCRLFHGMAYPSIPHLYDRARPGFAIPLRLQSQVKTISDFRSFEKAQTPKLSFYFHSMKQTWKMNKIMISKSKHFDLTSSNSGKSTWSGFLHPQGQRDVQLCNLDPQLPT